MPMYMYVYFQAYSLFQISVSRIKETPNSVDFNLSDILFDPPVQLPLKFSPNVGKMNQRQKYTFS